MDYKLVASQKSAQLINQFRLISIMTSQNEELLRNCMKLDDQMVELQVSLRTKDSETESLKDQLRRVEVQLDSSQAIILNLEKEIIQNNQVFQSELNDLKEQLSHMQGEVKIKNDRIVFLEEKEQKQNQDNEDFQKEYLRIKVEVLSLREQIEINKLVPDPEEHGERNIMIQNDDQVQNIQQGLNQAVNKVQKKDAQ